MHYNVIEFDVADSAGIGGFRITDRNQIRSDMYALDMKIKAAIEELIWVLETEGETNGEFCPAKEVRARIAYLEAERLALKSI